MQKRQLNNCSAFEKPNEIPPRDKFRYICYVIPEFDAFHSNLDRRATLYGSAADKFTFEIDLQAGPTRWGYKRYIVPRLGRYLGPGV